MIDSEEAHSALFATLACGYETMHITTQAVFEKNKARDLQRFPLKKHLFVYFDYEEDRRIAMGQKGALH